MAAKPNDSAIRPLAEIFVAVAAGLNSAAVFAYEFDGVSSLREALLKLVELDHLALAALTMSAGLLIASLTLLASDSHLLVRELGFAGGPSGDAVRSRFSGPIRAVLLVLQRWGISDLPGAMILGSSDSSVVARLRSGGGDLATRDMQDRARLLLDIYEGVYALLKDAKAEQEWLSARRDELDGNSLLELMTEGSQRNLIRALAFVDYANGR